MNIARIGQTILDFGCGSGEMLEVFYRNRYRPKQYLGLDVRTKTIEENKPTNNIPESTPSVIGRMLLEKDGWLEKHKEEDEDSLMKNKTSFRGGLGYEETKKSGYDAMILQGDSFFKK